MNRAEGWRGALAGAESLRLPARFALDVHSRVAMQILRRSRIAVTMNIHGEASSEDTRKALKLLGHELEGQ